MEKRTRKNFNKYIQLRDAIVTQQKEVLGKCIACGKLWILNNTYDWKGFHASHYWLENQYASVRFDERNVNGSCAHCNKELSGNLARYGVRLIEKIGQEEFDRLDYRRNQIKKFDVLELEVINKHCLALNRELIKTKFKGTYLAILA